MLRGRSIERSVPCHCLSTYTVLLIWCRLVRELGHFPWSFDHPCCPTGSFIFTSSSGGKSKGQEKGVLGSDPRGAGRGLLFTCQTAVLSLLNLSVTCSQASLYHTYLANRFHVGTRYSRSFQCNQQNGTEAAGLAERVSLFLVFWLRTPLFSFLSSSAKKKMRAGDRRMRASSGPAPNNRA